MVRIDRFGLHTAVRQRSVRVFLLTLLVTCLAKISAFLPGYSIDDYGLILQAPSTLSPFNQGRFGQGFLGWWFRLLEIDPSYTRILFVLFSILVWSLFATLVARYWNLERSFWLAGAVASMVANHPYTAEIFTFRTALGTTIFAFALLSLLLLPARWSPRLVLAGSGIFALTLSVYQIALHFCLMIGLMGTVIWLGRYLVLGSRYGWPRRMTSPPFTRSLVRNRNTGLFACALLGTGLYVAVGILVYVALPVQLSQRADLLPADQVGERAQLVLETLRTRLLEPGYLIAQPTKRILLLVLLSAVAGLLWRTRPWLRLRPPLVCLSTLGLLAVSLVWSLGLLLILREFWPAPRVMAHVGIFWAGTLAVAYLCLGLRARRALALLAFLIVLSFIGANNRILNDQLRLNARDAHKANRIVARLEGLPGFSSIEAVAFDGADWRYPLSYGTTEKDLNISAFGARWAMVAILREVSGYDIKPARTPSQIDAAAAYCRGVEPWPSPASVTIKNRLAIICL